MDNIYYADLLVEDYGCSYDEVEDMSVDEMENSIKEMDDEIHDLESIGWD